MTCNYKKKGKCTSNLYCRLKFDTDKCRAVTTAMATTGVKKCITKI